MRSMQGNPESLTLCRGISLGWTNEGRTSSVLIDGDWMERLSGSMVFVSTEYTIARAFCTKSGSYIERGTVWDEVKFKRFATGWRKTRKTGFVSLIWLIWLSFFIKLRCIFHTCWASCGCWCKNSVQFWWNVKRVVSLLNFSFSL